MATFSIVTYPSETDYQKCRTGTLFYASAVDLMVADLKAYLRSNLRKEEGLLGLND